MRNNNTKETLLQKPLRLWPGIVIVLVQWLARFATPIIAPEALTITILGGFFGWIAIIVWWAFFSRAPRLERWGAIVLMLVALVATSFSIHESMRLQPFVAYIIPVLSLAFVIWAVASHRLTIKSRRAALVVTILLACAMWTLIRASGIRGDASADFAWRWADSSEEVLMAHSEEPTALAPALAEMETEAEWPGFRGPNRDSIIRGVQIETDWASSPPIELWRRPIGPAWSSFAVHGNRFYTQEQRGENEVVSCYNMNTGEPIWRHLDSTRFWEANGGAGPRGTPTLFNGHVFAFGGTGILNVLNAADGSTVWSRNAATDTDTKLPTWGFSSSPLVTGDVVIVAVAGSLIAYDIFTGDPRWSKSIGGDCYSSPHLLQIDGVTQVVLLNDSGAMSVSPDEGTLLWQYPWPGHPIVQPTLSANGDILISADERTGVRRITISHNSGEWTAKELWASARIKPYFNDSIIHNGHAYGFHGSAISCIDFEDGERKWKGGRYGRGQIVMLADQNVLLVLSEKGDLALVEATPEQFKELTRISALDGKTWNHPVLVGDVLLVRNAQEMAAFQMPLAGG
jgi:outer membrane protein assembly factor BamB